MVDDKDTRMPLTGIAVVADKAKCPVYFTPLTKAFDDTSCEADVWKDSFFSFSAVYRYICISREVSNEQEPVNVVADISIINERDLVPPGFNAIEHTTDSNEKALRKKQLCVRMMPLNSAVDAVCDLIILARNKRPPAGYTMAGDIDGLVICFKYSAIPNDFLTKMRHDGSTTQSLYPNPGSSGQFYPNHPNAVPDPNPNINGVTPYGAGAFTTARQLSVGTGIDGVPFDLNPLLKAATKGHSQNSTVPTIRELTSQRLDSDYSYDFTIEQQCLETALLSQT